MWIKQNQSDLCCWIPYRIPFEFHSIPLFPRVPCLVIFYERNTNGFGFPADRERPLSDVSDDRFPLLFFFTFQSLLKGIFKLLCKPFCIVTLMCLIAYICSLLFYYLVFVIVALKKIKMLWTRVSASYNGIMNKWMNLCIVLVYTAKRTFVLTEFPRY